MPQPIEISNNHPLIPNLMAYPIRPLPPRLSTPRPSKQGQLFTFGSAVGGELGLGASVNERRKPGLLKRLKDIVAVECGGQHTLALDSQGRVYSWGVNDQGALGRPTEDIDEDDYDDDQVPIGTEAFIPLAVDIPAPVVQMVCADSFSAVLTIDGDVYAWGSFRDPSGVIGFSKTKSREIQKLPTKITAFGSEKVVLLGSGENHIFAVTSDDTVWAFGANDENQLGRRVSSRLKNNLEPYEIRGTGRHGNILHGIVKITGGAYHTLFINKNGELYAFGCNNCGQLGLGDILSHVNGPERIEFGIDVDGQSRIPLPPIVDIAAGESHSLAVSSDGRLFTWGANLEGQLGFHSDRPVYGDDRDGLPAEPPIEKKPKKRGVAMDYSSSSASSSTHSTPQKNTNSNRDAFKLKYQPLPRQVPPSDSFSSKKDPIVMVEAQSRFSICVSAQGNLFTWGSGHSFQLGNEEMDDESTPFLVELKGRKCFWAKCGGQFTMFLLEPKGDQQPQQNPSIETKQEELNKSVALMEVEATHPFSDFHNNPHNIPTSMPASAATPPSETMQHTPPRNSRKRKSPEIHMDDRCASPTSTLALEMYERLNSPDGKKRAQEARAAAQGEIFLKSPEKPKADSAKLRTSPKKRQAAKRLFGGKRQ